MGITRRWFVVLAGTMTLSLALVPTAGAVTDQDLTPDFTECTPPDSYPAGCTKPIQSEGKEFPPNTVIKFSWLEPDSFLLGAGGPGATVQQLTGAVCSNTFQSSLLSEWATPLTADDNRTLGPDSVIRTDANGTFDVTVNGPPENRLPLYGPNAVCAYWEHSPDVYRGVGNQYTIYPV